MERLRITPMSWRSRISATIYLDARHRWLLLLPVMVRASAATSVRPVVTA